MHTLKHVNGASGWYHECQRDECRRTHAQMGNSISQGWVSPEKETRCPLCGGRVGFHVDVNRPAEYRVVRSGDGLVCDRFPDTPGGLKKANRMLKRLA